jgi:2-keto-myo-inositol isomerase
MTIKPWPLCLNTSTIRPASLLDKLAIAAESGYAAIELWNDDLTQFEQQGGSLEEIKRRTQDLGLAVPSVIALFGWMQSEGESKREALEEARRRMAQAATVGAPRIVASPVPDNQSLDIGHAAARYRELLELGEHMGVSPAMEFLGFFRNVYQLEQAVAIARQADHPDASIVLDPFHLYRGGSGFGGLTTLSDMNISICHFNDSPSTPPQFEQGDGDRIYPGDGILPLVQMLHDLTAIGYDGYLSVELFNPNYWQQDLRKVARIAREKTEAIRSAAMQRL